MPARSASMQRWEDAFAAWRARLHVPQRIAVVEHEQRLPLDLTVPAHRLLLRQRINSAERLELREAPDPADLGWIGRPHEVLLAMSNGAAAPSTALPASLPDSPAHLPGRSTVLHAQLFGHPDRYDELLTEHLPELLATFDTPPAWWFHRHRVLSRPDEDQHLSLHLHLPGPLAYGPAAERLHDTPSGRRSPRRWAKRSAGGPEWSPMSDRTVGGCRPRCRAALVPPPPALLTAVGAGLRGSRAGNRALPRCPDSHRCASPCSLLP
ncbi:lantibiotic dehydratase [Streptomyces sp. NPDC048197]|uniref:lantibiotic dehydratase n=1 Tax=Streptomyces sp. NPDC048197 TaxID=3365511 RepID=UPI003723A3A2